MKKVWRWTKRIVLGTLAFVVLATGITLGALHTNWGRNRVRKIVEDQLQSTFPGSTIGKIDGSVLGDLIARDVTIMGRDKRPLVTIKKVTIEAALLPLASKTARVTKIDAEDVVVYAHDQGPPPPEKPPEPSTPSEPSSWSVELPAIHAHGRIEIETATGVERIDDLDTMVALSLRSGEPLKASVDTTARWRNQDLAVRAFVEQGDSLTVQYALVTLGSARVLAANAHVDGTRIDANVFAFAPAALVKQLAQVDLPGNAVVFAQLANTGHLTVDATVGAATARVLAKADLETKAVHAIVTADVPDLAAVVPNRQGEPPIAGSGTVVATVVATPDHVDGIVTIAGEAPRGTGNGLIAISATRERARVLVAATAESPPSRGDRQAPKQDLFAWRLRRLGGSTLIERANDGWFLREGTLEAAATGDAGEVTASLSATGALSPTPSLAVQGTVDGRSVRYNDTAIASLHTRFAATEIPARPTGDVSIEVNGLRQGTLAVPVVTLAAHGTLHEDGTIDVDLDRHRVRTADGQQWGGNSGHVRVTEQSIAATQLVTSSGKARITAQAQIGRTSDALTAKLTARDIAVATLDPTLQGTLGADVDVSRRDGMWKGTATIDANQIVVPNRPVLDGKLAVKIDKRRVTAVATASNPAIGSATLDLDV
ncbi:MAG TPA: hypothetical protein VFV99_10720, partial [Kofleriaceae bacterium]|nr:hypothetical protein [Kofleriaceae bacterium]